MVALFRDTKEELKRLQQELLEEETEEEQEEEEFPDEASVEQMLGESDPIPDTQVYRNFSNDYGRGLRNFASGYRAYNGDRTDTDLEEYSETVYRAKKKPRGCCGVLVLLALAAGAAVLLWYFYGGGVPW